MEDFATAVWPEQPVASPKGGRAAARPRARTTADAPTEITGAPTTPLPAGRRPTRPAPPAPKRKSRVGTVIGVVVAGAAGAGGYLVLGSRNAPRSKPAAPPPGPAADTVPDPDTGPLPLATPTPP